VGVSTFETIKSIRGAADAKDDERILHCLLSVNNYFIAAELNITGAVFLSKLAGKT